MSASPEAVATIVRYLDVVTGIRGSVDRYAVRLWDSLDSWRDADIARLVNAITPVSLGAQQRIVAATDAYLAALAELMGYARPPATLASGVTGEVLRGVPPPDVYRRSGVTVWSELARGTPLADAVDAGRARLRSTLGMDLQLARTHTARASLAKADGVVGYRRTLTGGENCALCVVASTQRYHRKELMAVHPGCDCGVAPITGDTDPGQVLDPDRLDALHDAVRREFGTSDRGGREPDYKLITVREHGEYGPTLTWTGQHFDGPKAVA